METTESVISLATQWDIPTWESSSAILLWNPFAEKKDQQAIKEIFKLKKKPRSIFVASSGSTQKNNESLRLIELTKEAFETSAKAVNQHLKATSQDRWSLALPVYHVGGFSILVRAMLSGSKVFLHHTDKWSATHLYQNLLDDQITLLSLVPTQLYDLLQLGKKAPPSLRAIVIGGAALPQSIYLKARALGWPVLASYGMTEFASQVATAPLDSEELSPKVLSHCQVRLNADQFLQIRSESLFKNKFYFQDSVLKQESPPVDGWFTTQDKAILEGNWIRSVYRDSDFVKIKGEGVNLALLREELGLLFESEGLNTQSFALKAQTHERNGYELILYVEKELSSLENHVQEALKKYHSQKPIWEKIQTVSWLEQIPRSPIGKILYEKIS